MGNRLHITARDQGGDVTHVTLADDYDWTSFEMPTAAIDEATRNGNRALIQALVRHGAVNASLMLETAVAFELPVLFDRGGPADTPITIDEVVESLAPAVAALRP